MRGIRFTGGLAVAVAAILMLPAAAEATPPTITSVTQQDGSIKATWTLPPGMSSWQFEVADAPTPGPGGAFPASNVVYTSLLGLPAPTTWTSARVVPGTYYVHVSAYGPCASPISPTCVKEFSEVKSIAVPEPRPPVIDGTYTTLDAQRRLTVRWDRRALVDDFIELATDPDVYPDGDDAAGEFLLENTVLADELTAGQYEYRTPPLTGGTYYVHVATYDPLRCPSAESAYCVVFFSQPFKIEVPPAGTPTLTASQFGGRLRAAWTLPGYLENDFLEIARSPAVYETGVDRGGFREENVVASQELDYFDRHYDHPDQLAPGTYYVHVAAYDRLACPSNVQVLCLDEYSPTVAVTVPAPPSAKPAAAPPADTVASLAWISVDAKQRIGSLVALAAMGEQGKITVGGTVSVPKPAKVYRFKAVVREARMNVPIQFTLRLPKKALKAVRKALKKHRKLTAKLTIKAEDRVGNVTIQHRTVKLAT